MSGHNTHASSDTIFRKMHIHRCAEIRGVSLELEKKNLISCGERFLYLTGLFMQIQSVRSNWSSTDSLSLIVFSISVKNEMGI